MIVPDEIRSSRLTISRWRPRHAEALQPVLAANVDHLAPWIPWRIAEPVPVAELVKRLEKFAAAFDANREWRYGIFDAGNARILGDIALFPRNETGRVVFDAADHVELGYWLRSDATGQGYATEAAGAALGLALSLPRIRRVTIHCDERNVPSAAVPQRLGFRHVATKDVPSVRPNEPLCRLQEWEYSAPAALDTSSSRP